MIARKKKFIDLRGLSALAILVAAGCASTPPAPVEDRSFGNRYSHRNQSEARGARTPEGSYRVRKGDTLYSIAFRNGIDYRQLAQANRIGPPYTIYVGQLIQLGGQRATQPVVAAERPSSSRLPPRELPASSPRSVTAPKPSVDARPSLPPVAPAPAPQRDDNVAATAPTGNWRWPAEGPLVARFVTGDQTRQGINIAGKSGDPVRASADGEVVYSGNGLIGYGELIIVKHSSTMLSAYGHNRRRLVQEGDRVKAGQQIAEMGSSSATRDMLHFEIRRNGKPIDPMGFLPKR